MKIFSEKNFIKLLSTAFALLFVCVSICGCTVPNDGDVSITIVQAPVYLYVGEVVELKVETSDKNATIEWYVGDESIATVDDGVIRGVSSGETQVVANYGSIVSICDVFVSEPPPSEPPSSEPPVSTPTDSIIINLSPVTVEVGKCVVLSAMSTTGKELKWYSVNSSVATVNNGVIMGVSVGETMISVSAGNSSASCKVKVVEASVGPTNPTNPTISKDGYTLLWNDEFDGDSLDTSKWGYQYGVQDHYGESHGPMYWGNSELQYYTDSKNNVGVKDGNLYITAKKESMGDRQYTSARILTRNKFSCTYGYFEARMKLPTQNAMWPAFWLLPEPSSDRNSANAYGGWPTSGEIDIMEARGRVPNKIGTALHYAVNNGHKYSSDTATLTFPISDWHIYAVDWNKDYLTWYVDGRVVMKLASSVWYNPNLNSSSAAPFDKPFFMLLNLAVGGNYDSGIEPNADFTEASMYVDYVRVWKAK